MIKVGTYIIDETEIDYYIENNQYFYINKNNERKSISKLQLATIVASAWDEDCIYEETTKENFIYISKKIIPIYDWIIFILYEYGKTKEESISNLEKTYKDLLEINEKYEENILKNKKKFLSKIKKFAFLYKDRTTSDLKHKDNIPELEFVQFEDGDLSFRELAIKHGIPSDARADEPIFGYIDGNKLVIFREIFLQGRKEMYMEFFKNCHKEIAKKYNLDEYELYFAKIKYEEISIKEKGYLENEFLSNNFEYYIPCNYQGKFKKIVDTYIEIENAGA